MLKVVSRFITRGNEMKLSKGKMRLGILTNFLSVCWNIFESLPEVTTDALLVESFKSICRGHHMLPITAVSKQSQKLRKLGQEGPGEVILASRDG